VVVPVNGPLRANNSEVLREAVLGGLGLGLLPDFSAGPPAPQRLVPVLPSGNPGASLASAVRHPPLGAAGAAGRAVLVDHLRLSLAA
jgi:DNA-binding transcriptional LysR family regulator